MSEEYKFQYRLLQQKIWEDARHVGINAGDVAWVTMWLDRHPEEVQRALDLGDD